MRLKLVTSDNTVHRFAVVFGLFPKCSNQSVDYSRFNRSHRFLLLATGSIVAIQCFVFAAQATSKQFHQEITFWYFLSLIPQILTSVILSLHFYTIRSVKFTLKVYKECKNWKKRFVIRLYTVLWLIRWFLLISAYFWWSYLDWKGRTTATLTLCRSALDYLTFAILVEMCSKIDTLTAAISKARNSAKVNPVRALQSEAGARDALEATNIMYRRQILVAYINFFTEMLIVLYFNVFSITATNRTRISIVRRVSTNFTRLLQLAISVVLPVATVEKHKQAVDEFYTELFRVVRQSDSLCNDRRLFLYLTLKKDVVFTACGFFSLNYPLILAIFAAVTSQLVVIIQFTLIRK